MAKAARVTFDHLSDEVIRKEAVRRLGVVEADLATVAADSAMLPDLNQSRRRLTALIGQIDAKAAA